MGELDDGVDGWGDDGVDGWGGEVCAPEETVVFDSGAGGIDGLGFLPLDVMVTFCTSG